VVVREAADPELLLIRRAERVGDPWSGHIAFPGGTRRQQDADLLATALRETHEETGIPLSVVGALLGPLDPVLPATPHLPPIIIAPFVATVPSATSATPDMQEVVDVFWIPLSHLRDARNTREFLLELEQGSRRFPSVHFGEHVIWGLTHRILVQFLELAEFAGI
jgi:8-oxo-dGTP pyrophosphatase MutT (NUDIX family)